MLAVRSCIYHLHESCLLSSMSWSVTWIFDPGLVFVFLGRHNPFTSHLRIPGMSRHEDSRGGPFVTILSEWPIGHHGQRRPDTSHVETQPAQLFQESQNLRPFADPHGLIQTHRTSQFHHPFISGVISPGNDGPKRQRNLKAPRSSVQTIKPPLGLSFWRHQSCWKTATPATCWIGERFKWIPSWKTHMKVVSSPGIRWTRARFERPNHRNQGFRGRGSSQNWNRFEASKSTPFFLAEI